MGILAHVDAGKTTLSEAILYNTGAIRNLGRVDNRDTFLDTDSIERQRGITVFSKQAIFTHEDTYVTLLDTPGHMDFSAETERTLAVLDVAVLLVSATDGVDGHTLLLWKALRHYGVPTVVFVNKTDMPGVDRKAVFENISSKFGGGIVDFSSADRDENIAMCDEDLMEKYLESGKIEDFDILTLLVNEQLFPVFWGSALRNEGVNELVDFICRYTTEVEGGEEFGARVFKITRDSKGERLTHVKITSGSCRVKETVDGSKDKINQIRIYSGEKFETRDEVTKGEVCAFVGLSDTITGRGLGILKETCGEPLMTPVQSYSIILPPEVPAVTFLPKLKMMEDEDPTLTVTKSEDDGTLGISVMGEVGLEILKAKIKERFNVNVDFAPGKILYRETVASPVEGVGHYEPLRHYSEVHLLLEPMPLGSGLSFDTAVSTDELDLNWQRLILTHLKEKEHKGVLTGSPITDMKITLVAGRAHLKHTEGGDFRQSTYRALRQGLMKTENILLEPMYDFTINLPTESVGRAMSDLERMGARFSVEGTADRDTTTISGRVSVYEMSNYDSELKTYTRGQGELICVASGYEPCHNSEKIIEEINYNPEEDLENTADSVFCSHGAGTTIPWYETEKYMHLPAYEFDDDDLYEDEEELEVFRVKEPVRSSQMSIGTDEIDRIIDNLGGANRGSNKKGSVGFLKRRVRKPESKRTYAEKRETVYKGAPKKKPYLLIDGYNVIFAWQELKELADINIDSARDRLMDIMSNYKAMINHELILVFDAYKVRGGKENVFDFHNIHVVFTKEAQTADQYIEKFAHENSKNYDITVVTSDGLEQIIIRGEGCKLISSREFELEVYGKERELAEKYGLK